MSKPATQNALIEDAKDKIKSIMRTIRLSEQNIIKLNAVLGFIDNMHAALSPHPLDDKELEGMYQNANAIIDVRRGTYMRGERKTERIELLQVQQTLTALHDALERKQQEVEGLRILLQDAELQAAIRGMTFEERQDAKDNVTIRRTK